MGDVVKVMEIPADLKEQCKNCKGTGHYFEPPYRDQPAYETTYTCSDCSGKGWVWTVTFDQAIERIARAEHRVEELEYFLHLSEAQHRSDLDRCDSLEAQNAALQREIAALRAPVREPVIIHVQRWYMRDNHTFLKLDDGDDKAMEQLQGSAEIVRGECYARLLQ